MTPRSLFALVALVVLLPAGARADDAWGPAYYADDGSDVPSEYDVSVDVGAPGDVTFETFEAPLSSYGDWVVAGSYGRAWRPRVATGWRPYYYGRWEWTNEGWFWVSDEPWGWAAYHYGRWAHDPYYGWIWVPGYEWAPAWVSWRTSGDVIGWAPLAPGLSVYVTAYPFVDFWWTFVPTVRFVSVPVYSVAYAPHYTRRWYHATAPSPARPAPRAVGGRPAPAAAPAWGGPAPRLIAERTGRPLTPARIVAAPSPAARARPGEIPVFRPEPRTAYGRGFAERGPGVAPPRRGSDGTPPHPGRDPAGRGAAVAPSPGRGPDGASAPPPDRGGGRGPGVAPAPRASRGEAEPGQRGERGGDRAPPAWRGEPRSGGSQGAAPSRGGGRGGRDGGGDRGDRGGSHGPGRPSR